MPATKPPKADARRDLIKGTLGTMILKTLSGSPMHGYGVMKRIESVSGDVLGVEEGSLYPALHRLEKRGYIEADWRHTETGRRAKFYALTRTGRAQLKEELDSWAAVSGAVTKVLTSSRAIGA